MSTTVVDESGLEQAAATGAVSGNKTDKSELLGYTVGETGAPLATDAKLTMECTVADVYETPAFENFMVKVNNTFADESILSEKGDKPDFDKFKPVLFEMPGYTYLKTGDTIGKCMSFGKKHERHFGTGQVGRTRLLRRSRILQNKGGHWQGENADAAAQYANLGRRRDTSAV